MKLLRPIIAVIIAFGIGAVIIWSSGSSPLEAYKGLFSGAFGDWIGIFDSLFSATPLILTGLATAISFKAGIFNIGVEGSMYLGAFAAAWFGFTFDNLPGLVIIIGAVAFSMAVGVLWGLLPAYLKVRWKVDEIVSTIMLNYVAILFTSYLVNFPFRVPNVANSMSERIAPQAQLPRFTTGSQLNIAFFVAVAVVVIFYIFERRSTLGYEIKMVGLNSLFSRSSGIRNSSVIYKAMMISGAIGALTGALLVLGTYYRFYDFFSPGYGFDGIAVAILSSNNFLGCLAVATLFGALRSGGSMMELFTGIPLDLVNVMEGVIILMVTANLLISRKRRAQRT